jgi:hypothetical protein
MEGHNISHLLDSACLQAKAGMVSKFQVAAACLPPNRAELNSSNLASYSGGFQINFPNTFQNYIIQ